MNAVLTGVKMVLGLGVSIGTGTIVGSVVKHTLPANTGKFTKGCVVLATYVIGSMAGKAVVEHFENDFDDTVEQVEEAIETLKELKKDRELQEGV